MKLDLRMGLAAFLVLAGLAISFVPRYLPRPAAEPTFAGTYWWAGVPLVVAGLALALYALRRPRAA